MSIFRRYVAAAAAATALLFTGCRDSRELDNLAMIQAVGVDLAEGGAVEVTVQIVKPRNIAAAGSTSPGGDRVTWELTGSGESVSEVVRQLNGRSSRELYWPHCRLLILGRNAAEAGCGDLLDYFIRSPEVRSKLLIAVADGTAREMLGASSSLEQMLPDELGRLVEEYDSSTSGTKKVTLGRFVNDSMDAGGAAAAPVLRLTGDEEKRPEVRGLAVFRGMRMTGLLSPDEARGYACAADDFRGGSVTVECGGPVSLDILSSKTSVTVTEGAGVTVKLKIEQDLTVTQCSAAVDLKDPAQISRIETAAQEAAVKDVIAAAGKARDLGTDALGLERIVRRKAPSLWKRFFDGECGFEDIDLVVTVRCRVRLTGKKLDPAAACGEADHGR